MVEAAGAAAPAGGACASDLRGPDRGSQGRRHAARCAALCTALCFLLRAVLYRALLHCFLFKKKTAGSDGGGL